MHDALQNFARAVTAKSSTQARGAPEDQLRAPLENFLAELASAWKRDIVCTGEPNLPDRLGRPDYAVHSSGLLAGYIELKAPGTGADGNRFRGRDREQFDRFSAIPNLLYTDGNEWALYRGGERVGNIVRFPGDVATDGEQAVTAEDARALEPLLRDFIDWEPVLPFERRGQLDPKGFAAQLAPLCRLLRDDVTDALRDPSSRLVRLAADWRELLFPNATEQQFADAYAQTVVFALLLARAEGANPLTFESAVKTLASQHNLLSRALQVLVDQKVHDDLSASLELLRRVLAVVPPALFADTRDPWLYFYEDFLAAYDPKLRKDAGVYYTPVEVVRAQVRLLDDLLVNRLNRPLGFAEPDVVTLDPATGTGTYLLGVIEHALNRVETEQGKEAVGGQANLLAANLHGFELMVGPYAVAELRVSRALRARGAQPGSAARVFLTDTLESPHAEPPQLPLFMEPISRQREQALTIKREVPVLVCLGNPPYDRHEAATPHNGDRTGAWVRRGDNGEGGNAILGDFLRPAIDAGFGGSVKNLYNLYVYFWRWALWKVFEQEGSEGNGAISFITASSWLDGDAFRGMREHMRRGCDEVWILDLGGEGRGTRQNDNVFAIQTPVAIAIALRTAKTGNPEQPARVRYARIDGSRDDKLVALDAIRDLSSVDWRDCPDDWQAPFRPAGKGAYFGWPLLTNLLPWQHSGVQLKRIWPIAPDVETLKERWRELLRARNRAKAFRETGDREINGTYRVALTGNDDSTPLAALPDDAPMPEVREYAYRSFDRHHIIADARLMSRPRPDLWRVHSDRQMYLTSLFSQPLGRGPALTSTMSIPDLDHFRGSYGAKHIIPLYRAADASEANILPGLPELLSQAYGRDVTPEDFFAYVYGVLAHPGFTAQFSEELETRELHVPITRDAELFDEVRELGARLLRLHTRGERFVPPEERREKEQVWGPLWGVARCTRGVSGEPSGYPEKFEYDGATRTLRVGAGEFSPVAPEIYEFEVSGLKVVQSWLRYRMKKGAGRKSSPLDNIRPERWTAPFTTELLNLLWTLEATVESYPEQEKLFAEVLKRNCFQADELPPVPDEARKAPRQSIAADASYALELDSRFAIRQANR